MPTITPGTPQHSLVDAFRKTLSEQLSQALASPWSVEISPEEAAPANDPAASLSFGLAPSGSLQGNAAFQLRNADALLLAQSLLKESPNPAADLDPARKQAVEGLLQRVAQATATALKAQCGEVSLQVSNIEPPAWPGVSVSLVASEASAGTFSIQLRLGTELLAALPPLPAGAPAPTLPADVGTENVPASGGNNLDLLLGVDLDLTLRFGQRSLALREILDLSSGSVIELDRRVQEPADLLLGDKLIARGEVVIVDGNYGLRITEVCDPQHTAARGVLSAAR